jgi:TRAP transporter TAXI family solute receptor
MRSVLSMRGSAHALLSLAAIAAAVIIASDNSWAQSSRRARTESAPAAPSLAEQINHNTVSIISGNLNATYLSIAYDLSAVLDQGNEFRVLPIVGKGGGQNIRDVRFLKGVDLGITQSNLLGYFKRTKELGPIDDKIVYIARLFNEEMHLVVRADSGFDAIEQLTGQKINFSDVGSGTQLSTRDIFDRLGIKVQEVNMGQADAFEALKRGDIAATILIAGKPAASMTKLRTAEGFKLLPVPYAKPLHEDYLPATLNPEDYPGMIEAGRPVETVAVGAVLIAYNWPQGTDRYRRIEKFVENFFPRLAEFQKAPRHAKWREANLAAVIPGWERFPAAEEWLTRNRAQASASAKTRDQFEKFVEEKGSRQSQASLAADEREKLFQEFLKWSQARDRR